VTKSKIMEDVASWVSKNLRDAPWSSPALADFLTSGDMGDGRGAVFEILKGFEEGKFDSTTKQRVILAFFYLDARVLGRLKPEVSCLLDFVDKHENNEWVILACCVLRNALSDDDVENGASSDLAPVTKIVDSVLSSSNPSKDVGDQFYFPEEFSILNPKLLPLAPSHFAEKHFTPTAELVAPSAGAAASLTGAAEGGGGGGGGGAALSSTTMATIDRKKRPRSHSPPPPHAPSLSSSSKATALAPLSGSPPFSSSSSSSASGHANTAAGAAAGGAYVPSERVLSVVGVHTNRLTADIGTAIERLLDLKDSGKVSGDPAEKLKLKVHEEIEGGTKRVSIYIRLEFGPQQARWEKIRKAKNIA